MISLLALFGFVTLSTQQEKYVFCDEPVEFNNQTYGNLITNLKLNSENDVILTENKILILDDNLNILSELPNPSSLLSPCRLPFKHSADLFFLGCLPSSGNPVLHAYKRVNSTHFEDFGNLVQLQTIANPVMKFDVAENTLFVQQKEKVTLFTLVIQATTWDVKTTSFVFDNNYLGRPSVNLTDITFKSYVEDSVSYYKILLVDYEFGAFWIDAVVRNNILSPFRFGNIYLKGWFTYTHYYNSAVIHSTRANQTHFLINFYNYGMVGFQTIINSVTSTTTSMYFSGENYQNWPSRGKLIMQKNVYGQIHTSSLNQHALVLFNYIIPVIGDVSVEADNNLRATDLSPSDVITEQPKTYAFAYFNTQNRIVHTISANKLQSCDLYNYKLESEHSLQ